MENTPTQRFDETPEVAPQNYPEVAPLGAEHAYQFKEGQSPHPGYGPVDGSTVYSAQSPYQQYVQPTQHPYVAPAPSQGAKSEEKTVCGCSLLVFILTCIIAVLSAAVIGLAAGTGVEANRASDFQAKYEALSAATATATSSAASATSTSFNSLTNGCSDHPETTTNTSYTSFSLLGPDKYIMYCNLDTPYSPLMGLFVSNFNTCMDACSSWSKYVPDVILNRTSINNTCAAVSFIPLWTDKSKALAGGAPGNCYLKHGPQNETALEVKDIGTEVHAAVLQRES